jgi:hypothetical protein
MSFSQIFNISQLTNSYIFVYHDIQDLLDAFGFSIEAFKELSRTIGLDKNISAKKSAVKNRTITLDSGVTLPFNATTFSIDDLEVLAIHEDGSNTVVEIEGFPMSTDQLRQLNQYKALMRNADVKHWLNLPQDLFFELITKQEIKGKDLISLCLTNPKLNAKCNKPNSVGQTIFARLLREDFDIRVQKGQDARQLYLRNVDRIRTYYKMKVKPVGGIGVHIYQFLSNPVQFGKSTVVEKVPGWSIDNMSPYVRKLYLEGVRNDKILEDGLPPDYYGDEEYFENGKYVGLILTFAIKGYPIASGKKIWLLINQSEGGNSSGSVNVFSTESEAIGYFIEENYEGLVDKLEDMRSDRFTDDESDESDENDERHSAIHDTKFLKQLGVPIIPFTKDQIQKYLSLDSNHFYLYRDSERDNWDIMEVEF